MHRKSLRKFNTNFFKALTWIPDVDDLIQEGVSLLYKCGTHKNLALFNL